MTSLAPLIAPVGPAYDIEASYLDEPIKRQKPPSRSIPFRRQGAPLPDPYQVHTGPRQIYQMTKKTTVNTLPYDVWYGTVIPQINQPDYLSVNEKR